MRDTGGLVVCVFILNVLRKLVWDSEKMCVSVRLSLSVDVV